MSDRTVCNRSSGQDLLGCLLSASQNLLDQGKNRSPGIVSEVGSSGQELLGALHSTGQHLVARGQVSPLILEVGTMLAQNWGPMLTAGNALLGGGGLGRVLGAGLTAGVAKLGLSLLERRLARTREERRAGEERARDPLRGVSSRSKAKTKSKVIKASKATPEGQAASPLQQLTSLFPSFEPSLLGDILAGQDGNLEGTIDFILSLPADCPTADQQSQSSFLFPPTVLQPSPSSPPSPLPPCPDCPVCLSSLAGRRIYQCSQGHSLCQTCRNKPQGGLGFLICYKLKYNFVEILSSFIFC